MTNTLKRFALALTLIAGVLSWSITTQAAYAYILSTTTLNGAITASATSVVLTSGSKSSGSNEAPAAGQCLWVDTEMMRITAMSSATATVIRGLTANPTSHATGRVVYTGQCNRFYKTDPPWGTCLSANQTGPWINVNNGNLWMCPTDNSNFVVTNPITITYNSQGLV